MFESHSRQVYGEGEGHRDLCLSCSSVSRTLSILPAVLLCFSHTM